EGMVGMRVVIQRIEVKPVFRRHVFIEIETVFADTEPRQQNLVYRIQLANRHLIPGSAQCRLRFAIHTIHLAKYRTLQYKLLRLRLMNPIVLLPCRIPAVKLWACPHDSAPQNGTVIADFTSHASSPLLFPSSAGSPNRNVGESNQRNEAKP